MENRPSLLITGVSGGLAGILVERLAESYHLVGVDPRPMPEGRIFPGQFHQVHYTSRRMADIIRRNSFETLLHLGRIRASARINSVANRYDTNVIGTRNLLDLVRKYGIKNIVVFSTYHVYGANRNNPSHITEEDPLRASQTFPELADSIELDHAATTFLWRYRDIRTVVLRPVNVIGPRIRNTISTLLRSKLTPVLMGYNPMTQFIHEEDIAHAVSLCLASEKSGIYNVAGEGAVPYTEAVRIAGGNPVPIPHPVAYSLVGALSKVHLAFPKHLMDYFRYQTILSDQAFRKDFGYEPRVTTMEALRSLRHWKGEVI